MFIVCAKESHKIVPMTNLNDYEYFKQKLNIDHCTQLYWEGGYSKTLRVKVSWLHEIRSTFYFHIFIHIIKIV